MYDGNESFTGAAYIYRDAPPNWREETILFTSDGQQGDQFGNSVATDGELVVVGAPAVDGPKPADQDFGAVYIYRLDGLIWVETEVTASDGAHHDKFGRSVSVSGDVLITGADEDDDNGIGSGSAYIYRYDGQSWIEEAKILASDGAAGDNFGTTVSIDGDTAVVGADTETENGMYAGAAYVYRYDKDASEWVEEAKLLASNGQSLDFFGHSVAISGSHIIVGAPQNFNGMPGAAYIYQHNGSQWSQQAVVRATDGVVADHFGISVAIHEAVSWINSGSLENSYLFRGLTVMSCHSEVLSIVPPYVTLLSTRELHGICYDSVQYGLDIGR